MGSCMDHASWGSQGLQRVDELQMQEDMQEKLQVSQAPSTLHQVVRLRWEVLLKLI